MTANDDSWDRKYKTAQAYNYEKREGALKTSTTIEEALKNAYQLIESEEQAKMKAERKEAKKKRQKEKKKAEQVNKCIEGVKTLSNSTKSLNSNVTTKIKKTETVESSKDEHSEYSDQEEQIDDEFLDINAAFVRDSVRQNKNVAPNKTSVRKPEKAMSSLDLMSMPLPKFFKRKMTKGQMETAVTLGMQSCCLALNNNNFERAIEFLSQAISVAPEDARHFLNRSSCYLRLGEYSLALSDAKMARKKSQFSEYFSKAIACEGQALCGLQQYHEAEKCFEEMWKLEERNEWILTELIHTRALQLTHMGFSMISALTALQQCSSVVDAVTLLTSDNISCTEIEAENNESEIENCNGDEIYFSDDESSNTLLLSELVSAITVESCYLEDLQFQPSSSKTRHFSTSSEKSLKSSTSMESLPRGDSIKPNGSVQWKMMNNFKSVSNNSKIQAQKSIASESSSIWVGSIDKNVTEHQLRELFGVFGKINYIRRFPDERNYVFIDFKNKNAVTKALSSENDFEINGVKLPVAPSTGFSGKK